MHVLLNGKDLYHEISSIYWTFIVYCEAGRKLTQLPDPVASRLIVSIRFKLYTTMTKMGVVFFYIAREHLDYGNRLICVIYGNGQIWSSFGLTIAQAIEGAIRDGWLYTK
jgi:hypothetical protein